MRVPMPRWPNKTTTKQREISRWSAILSSWPAAQYYCATLAFLVGNI